jgi:hypothetical protein
MVPVGRIELRPVIENMEVAGSKRRQKPKTLKIPNNADNWNVSGTLVFEASAVAKRIPALMM